MDDGRTSLRQYPVGRPQNAELFYLLTQAEKLKKIETEVQNWMEKKKIENKLRKKLEIERKKTEEELQEENKRTIEEKAKVKYAEWLEKQKEKDKVLK